MSELSANARKLLERVKKGHFYKAYDAPKSMKELEDAGLVYKTGRVVVIESCYVPTEGYTPYVEEEYK